MQRCLVEFPVQSSRRCLPTSSFFLDERPSVGLAEAVELVVDIWAEGWEREVVEAVGAAGGMQLWLGQVLERQF